MVGREFSTKAIDRDWGPTRGFANSNMEGLWKVRRRPTHHLSAHRVAEQVHRGLRHIVIEHETLNEARQDSTHHQSIVGRLEVTMENIPRVVEIRTNTPIHEYNFNLWSRLSSI